MSDYMDNLYFIWSYDTLDQGDRDAIDTAIQTIEQLKEERVELYEMALNQAKTIEAYQKLAAPCECKDRIGMCVPCSMRDMVAGGDSVESVVNYFYPPEET